MRRIAVFLIIISSITTSLTQGQKASGDASQELEKLYGRFVNNYIDADRIRVNDSIRFILDSYVLSDSVFRHRFKRLRYLGQIVSPDSMVKIVTWNLILTTGTSKYFCYVIKKKETGKGRSQAKGNKIYRLTADYTEDPIKTDTTYTELNWYGALYYEIKPYVISGKKSWMLLGIDYGNPNISRKLIDVVSFSNNDSILFGNKWFESGGKMKFREVFEYASNGMMSLRFKNDSSIVFDHLVPFSPAQKNDRQFYGPDYSSDAYNLSKGIWRLIINIDARNNQ